MKYLSIFTVLLGLIFFTPGQCSLIEASFEEVESYQLSSDHPLYKKLEKIFSRGNILKSNNFFFNAGFRNLSIQPSGMYVARHPALPGYLVKAYLDTHPNAGELQWMIDRCKGAENIRKLIKEKNLKHFLVPKKWIYYPPHSSAILVVEDMNLVSKAETKMAWQEASKSQIRELFILLDHGFGSCYLSGNIPYTKLGKFACVDTAYPYREHNYVNLEKYLSKEMFMYLNRLAGESGK